MKLQELFKKLPIDEKYNFDINKITTNTNEAEDGSLFIAIKGTAVDTHNRKYIDEAYKNGARAFVTEEEVRIPKDAVQFVVSDTRKTVGLIASTFYGHPSQSLKIIGITGTKGKTSCTFILKGMLEKLGKKCGIIGTSGAFFDNEHIELKNTTPDPITLQKLLRRALDMGLEYILMEVSSQAMKQWRVMGTKFLITAFTNISPDHIGPTEHKDFEEYMSWKRKFLMLSRKVIMNSDDEHFTEMTTPMKNTIVTVGESGKDFTMTNVSEHAFDLNGRTIETNLMGKYNMRNLALSIATLNEVGFRMDDLVNTTSNIFIPGRMEIIEKNERKFVIDYAHNKLSLLNLLSEIKSWKPGRIIVVVGTVGERTFERRHEIPEAINQYAHEAIFTADNPNHEDPEKIANEMASHSLIPTKVIADRKTAIETAFRDSNPGDVIVVAGKGDETHQLINGERIHYSDREIIEKL